MVTHYSDRSAIIGMAEALRDAAKLVESGTHTLTTLGEQRLDEAADNFREALRWFTSDDY